MSLAEASYPLDAHTAAAVEARVLPRAGEQTLAEFKASLTRAVHALDPRRIDEQHRQAMAERRVCVTPRDDGMAELWALLPAQGAAAVMAAVNALAQVSSADDERSVDQRRADALVDLGVAALHDPHLPTTHGMRPTINVTVAAVHPARPRPATRRARRPRAHLRIRRPTHRRRRNQHLAPPDHRPG